MESGQSGSFWEVVRSWADSAGLLLPTDPQDPPRPKVPQAVCDSCPICQAAATLDQVNPQVVVDMTEVARSVLAGLGSALSSASDQRTSAAGFPEPGSEWDDQRAAEEPVDAELVDAELVDAELVDAEPVDADPAAEDLPTREHPDEATEEDGTGQAGPT